jgi:hypothetical protein
MATEWQRFTVTIPKGLDAGDREVLADDIIEFIRDRTKDGKSWRNRDLPGYSDSYANSLNFKIAGKSKNDVNLTQSGDMLGALTLLDNKDGKLVIGYEKGSQENAIADGNIRGTYGKDKQVGPKRDFLGITKADLSRILENFTPEDAAAGKGAKQGMSDLSGKVDTTVDHEDDDGG